jgi:hypothetical protein
MPALLVVKRNTSNVPQSPSKWWAGEIVAVVDEEYIFGADEQISAGNFFQIVVTDMTVEEAKAYIKEWGHEPTSEIVATNGTGGFRVRITSLNVSASGKNAITRAQMDGFVTQWNGAHFAHTNTTYTFDITTYQAATSEGFWGDTTGTVFADAGFAAGVQTVQIVSSPYSDEQIIAAAQRLGGSVEAPDLIHLPASALYEEFKDDIERAWGTISFKRRIWEINSEGMTYLANNEGRFVGTAAQIAPYLDDGLLG